MDTEAWTHRFSRPRCAIVAISLRCAPEGLLFERCVRVANRPIDQPPLDVDFLAPECHLLLDRRLFDAGVNAHATALHLPLTNLQLLLEHR
jgi:hypothetical protein